MSEEKFEAKLDQVKGSVKENAGKLTGDKELEAEGKADKVIGKASRADRSAADGRHIRPEYRC